VTAHRFQRLLAARDAQAHLVRVDAAQINEMEPALDSRFQQSLYLPGEAQIDDRALLSALVISLEEAGIRCHWQILVEGDALPAPGGS